MLKSIHLTWISGFDHHHLWKITLNNPTQVYLSL